MGLLTRVQTFKSNLVIKVSIIDVRMQAKNSGFDSIVDSELQNGNHDCVNLGFSGWAQGAMVARGWEGGEESFSKQVKLFRSPPIPECKAKHRQRNSPNVYPHPHDKDFILKLRHSESHQHDICSSSTVEAAEITLIQKFDVTSAVQHEALMQNKTFSVRCSALGCTHCSIIDAFIAV